ncbi:TetR/AcrR family transcriptional regulator [Sneathiella litorea]|uniref:TetR family transcriptional regulator n=1 Tax=Sneathiella litorea TaxID=2606216 RepID=A0A6L8WB63_9PROT|nr:TetR/AcrR family transcriptional regulator [Sneathiella litorea]MZR32318.1 TetR family transcriptional regulator [Sneathiella litorea]
MAKVSTKQNERQLADKAPPKKRVPGATRKKLLASGRKEFANRGLEGARVDEIAKRAGVNKQLVYHHFGNKDELYRHVLESIYQEIREREQALKLDTLPPLEALQKLVEFSFDYTAKNRDFAPILIDENVHKGRHMKDIQDLESLHSPLISAIEKILERGRKDGTFRSGLEPEQLYISIAALGFFYFSNIYTLSAIFGHKLDTRDTIAKRKAHVVKLITDAVVK